LSFFGELTTLPEQTEIHNLTRSRQARQELTESGVMLKAQTL
jgi:hypothetical protein